MCVAVVMIFAVAVFFFCMGVFALAAPAALVRPFRIPADAPESRSEIRAVYGGFGIAMSVLLGLAAFDTGGIRSGAVIAVAVALTGMASGRLVSCLVDGPTAFYPIWFYFGVEAAAAGLLFSAV